MRHSLVAAILCVPSLVVPDGGAGPASFTCPRPLALVDRWQDVDADGTFYPGEDFVDANDNGVYDPGTRATTWGRLKSRLSSR